MRGISNNTGYSSPLSPLGTGLNAPPRQPGGAFDTPAAENPAPTLMTARGAALTSNSALGPETVSTLLQAQEMGQEMPALSFLEAFSGEDEVENEVTRFLNARKKISKIMTSIEEGDQEDPEKIATRELGKIIKSIEAMEKESSKEPRR